MISQVSRTCRLLVAVVLAAALLGGCATGDFGRPGGLSGERRAESLALEGRHAEAAGIYIALAAEASGSARDRLTLLAAEQWLDAGDVTRARSAMSEIAPPGDDDLRRLWTTNRAAVELWQGEPDNALSLLEPMAAEPMALRHRLRVEALRADAWFQKRDPLRAVDLYLQREEYMDDARQIERNRQRLWAGLTVSNAQVLRQAAEIAPDPIVRGWLALGVLAASTGQQGIGWSNGVVRWRETHPDHPAMAIVADLDVPDRGLLDYPRQIALLLPLSGGNATAGRALQHGFLGAYYSATAGRQNAQEVRVYDVAERGAAGAYSDAVSAGADFVIGPLLRNEVAELAAEALLPVPVLTLNYLPDDTFAPPGMYQFALSPEDEAASAARRAIADGQRLGVALVPNNDWGRRLLGAFATEFEGLGGTLLEYRSYEPTDQDFSFEIESLMGLADSVQRYSRLRANIGGPLQFDPRRRQDVDFVFLAAAAPVGRLLKSQLKFHYSGDLPVYSTSRIYAMDGRADDDLDGVMFADTPWTVGAQPWIRDLADSYGEFWPTQRRLGRLHAMGYDAYQLVSELYASGPEAMPPINGTTGRLYVDTAGRVHRELAWAEFRNGSPEALEEPEVVEEIDDLDAWPPEGEPGRSESWRYPIREL